MKYDNSPRVFVLLSLHFLQPPRARRLCSWPQWLPFSCGAVQPSILTYIPTPTVARLIVHLSSRWARSDLIRCNRYWIPSKPSHEWVLTWGVCRARAWEGIVFLPWAASSFGTDVDMMFHSFPFFRASHENVSAVSFRQRRCASRYLRWTRGLFVIISELIVTLRPRIS